VVSGMERNETAVVRGWRTLVDADVAEIRDYPGVSVRRHRQENKAGRINYLSVPRLWLLLLSLSESTFLVVSAGLRQVKRGEERERVRGPRKSSFHADRLY